MIQVKAGGRRYPAARPVRLIRGGSPQGSSNIMLRRFEYHASPQYMPRDWESEAFVFQFFPEVAVLE
jgi:hypothetical protein